MDVKVKSLKKALDILDCFSIEKPELSVTEISKMTDLYKSNVHNILSTLAACGYIEQNPDNEKYRLGLKLLTIANIRMSSVNMNTLVNKCLTELVKQINEVIYYGIPYGDKVIYLEAAYPETSLKMRFIHGITAPLYCTGIGKAILAFSDEEKIENILSKPLERFTENTITDPDKLRKELSEIRKNGYSIDNMEHQYGIKCVGVPIFNRQNKIIGAISTSGPSLRFDDEKYSGYYKLIREKTEYIKHSI